MTKQIESEKDLLTQVAMDNTDSNIDAFEKAAILKKTIDLNQPVLPATEYDTDNNEDLHPQGWLRHYLRKKILGRFGL